jgi:flagellar hook-length control protein FliK
MNGEEMNSASLLTNLMASTPPTPAASTAAGVEAGQYLTGTGGFDQALATAQAKRIAALDLNLRNAEPVSLELVAGLLSQTASTTDSGCAIPAIDTEDAGTAAEATADAAQSGSAAILMQMLGTPAQLGQAPAPASHDPLSQEAAQLPAEATVAEVLAAGTNPRTPDGDTGENSATVGRGSSKASSPDPAVLDRVAEGELGTPGTVAVQEKTLSHLAANAQVSPAGQTLNAQAVVQVAALALRESAPVPATDMPIHSSLREPVGTARWADELGDRLVLMSVRGQQHGSLTLTPEHLGPMEVQISVNKDTASVWFGAQNADTRAALAEAMPRLREMLASTGLSLGQSGVSEQAPRETRESGSSGTEDGTVRAEADAIEGSTPAWRSWRPGLIDTYA